MSNFEDTTNERQPYLSTDPTVIAPFEEFEPTFEYLSLKSLLPYAQHIYLHWKERRIKRMGKPIAPTLKFEENEKDNNDPYICFRRREVRQVRKTRRQDAVSSERIRRLKAEMQQSRDLVAMVSHREKCRETSLKSERAVFLMRTKFKEVKRKLAVVGGDEDLVPIKKKKPVADASANVRNAVRPDGSITGPLTMVSLSDYRRKRNAARNTQIDKRCQRKFELNLGWSDQTEEEYFDILSEAYKCFRNLAVTESPADAEETDADSIFSSANSESSMSSVGSTRSASRYRQRYGRGGRVYIDRTLTAGEKEELEKTAPPKSALEERLRFDPRLSADEKPIALDEFSIDQISYRARLLPPPPPRNTIRISTGSMSSPLVARPQIVNSPSASRQSLPFQTPK